MHSPIKVLALCYPAVVTFITSNFYGADIGDFITGRTMHGRTTVAQIKYLNSEFAICDGIWDSTSSGAAQAQALLELKPSSKDYLRKQIGPFLSRFGNFYVWDVGVAPLEVTCLTDSDEALLEKMGFYLFKNQATNRAFLNRRYRADGDPKIVLINPLRCWAASVEAHRVVTDYIGRLGLMSLSGDLGGIVIKHDQTVTGHELYLFRHQKGLILDQDFISLDDAFEESSLPLPQSDATVQVTHEGLQLSFWNKRYLRIDSSLDNHEDCSKGENGLDKVSANRLAACFMLMAIAQHYQLSQKPLYVERATLKLKRRPTGDAINALIDSIAEESIHACPRCGRPLLGRSAYCKFGACAQRYNEAAKTRATSGRFSEQEIIEMYPSIRPATIHAWFEFRATDFSHLR